MKYEVKKRIDRGEGGQVTVYFPALTVLHTDKGDEAIHTPDPARGTFTGLVDKSGFIELNPDEAAPLLVTGHLRELPAAEEEEEEETVEHPQHQHHSPPKKKR